MPDTEQSSNKQQEKSSGSSVSNATNEEWPGTNKRPREDKDEGHEDSKRNTRENLNSAENSNRPEKSKDNENREQEEKSTTKKIRLEGSKAETGKTDVIETAGKKEQNGTDNESKSDAEKPKFVFGSGTAFSSGFGSFKKSDTDNGESSKAEMPSKPFAFGSGFSFGSGFGVLKKKADADNEKKDTDEEKKSKAVEAKEMSDKSNVALKGTIEESVKPSVEQTPIKLQKQEIKSGEESEETIYQVNAKLYQLSDFEEGWKERGVGAIKVNQNSNTEKARLIMRSRGILKVILNLPLIKGIKIQRGFPGSLQSEKFVRVISVNDNKAPVQYAFKTGKEETASELYDSMVKLAPQ